MSDDDVTRARGVLPFLPFLLIGLINVTAEAFGWRGVMVVSKVLLLPALAVGVLASARRTRVPVVLLVALGLSWIGDIALEVPGELWFVVGLGGFLLSHVAYLVLFTGVLKVGRPPLAAVGYAVWFVVLIVLLWPHLGALTAPVVLYGAILTTMAAFAAAGGVLPAWGGLLFVVSDSLLALGKFLPGFEFPLRGALIMATYIAAQGLIAAGVLRRVEASRTDAVAVGAGPRRA